MNSNPPSSTRQEKRVLLLESFYGGSHRDVADAVVTHSRHHVDMLTLPARFWKWRMRGASLSFVNQLAEAAGSDARGPASSYDLILCSGLMDVAALRSLIGPACPPVLLYCHESQLAYPQPRMREADLHFAFTDLVNMLTADRVLFNSHTHRRAFLAALPGFLRKLPEYRPMWSVDAVEAKSSVCYPGISIPDGTCEDSPHARGADPAQRDGSNAAGTETGVAAAARDPGPPLIVWNHRWEFDKQPEEFFAALRELAGRGTPFRVALLGENYNTVPPEFPAAREELGERVAHYGYLPDKADYRRWLKRGTVVVSTAIQENFGISVMEAVAHGCHPILPNRLSYPEIVPDEFHESVLYEDREGLVNLLDERLRAAIAPEAVGGRAQPALVEHARGFAWERRIEQFDAEIDAVAEVDG